MHAELEALAAHLARLVAACAEQGAPLFSGSEAPLVARAPGRLDVMGGFGDYSGCLALEMPIAEGAFAIVQKTHTPHVRVVSAGFGQEPQALRDLRLPLAELSRACTSYAEARRYFRGDAARAWAAYIVGALVALRVEHGVELGGVDIVICSRVPEGKGVSSSAAVEVASFQALAALAGVALNPVQVALTCQRIENRVVGAPCGAMDQLTSCCGSEGQILPILCQPAQLGAPLTVPPGLHIWGVDSCIRHQVSGADYTEVRVAAFMGYTIIAHALGMRARRVAPGKVQIDDARFQGYLADVGVDLFERELEALLPERLSGEDFSSSYGGIIDPVTEVVPSAVYRVRAATAHPIHEHARASEFRALLQAGAGAEVGPRLGELMGLAHDSYGACGLGSTGTDRLVALVRELGPARGLYGAKITGGGSGGTVAVLGASSAEPAVRSVLERYARETGTSPRLLSGSSCGAAEFGIARLVPASGGLLVQRDASGESAPV